MLREHFQQKHFSHFVWKAMRVVKDKYLSGPHQELSWFLFLIESFLGFMLSFLTQMELTFQLIINTADVYKHRNHVLNPFNTS